MRILITKQWLRECLFLLLYAAVIVAIELPRSLFGLNMEDEGWVLTACQNIFSYPSSVSYNFLYYNGVLVDGIWNLWFGQYGLLAFRVLYVIAEIIKAFIVYFILQRYCNKYAIVIGYAISIFFVIHKPFFFYHNELTSLLCLLSIFFIVKSLEKKKWQYMFIGGCIVGINVFTRIPNIVLCGLILVVLVYWMNIKDNNIVRRLFISAIGGFLVGGAVEIIIMCCLGHLPIFIDNISSGFSASKDADSTHNLLFLGKEYLHQLHAIWLHAASICFISCVFLCLQKKIKPLNVKAYFWLIGILSLLTIALAYYQVRTTIDDRLFALQTIICIYIIWGEKDMLKYIATLAVLYLYLLPLGSDWGYTSGIIYQAFRLSLTLSVAYIITSIVHSQEIQRKIYVFPVYLFMLITLGYTACHSTKYYVRDCTKLLHKENNQKIHSQLATTYNDITYYTTILNALLDELSKYVQPGDVLLCFQSPAMVHYLTETRPYLENAWPWTYTATAMEKHFIKAQAETDTLPVIVREKGWVQDIYNYENYPDWDNSDAMENRYHKNKNIKLIQSFIQINNYSVVWENNAFQILLPPQ